MPLSVTAIWQTAAATDERNGAEAGDSASRAPCATPSTKARMAPGRQARSGLRRRDAIHRMLYDAGLSPNLKGCRYLRLALEMASDSPYLLDNLAGRLYPAIAQRSGDTTANVERSIRYAIALICRRMDPEERVRLIPCGSLNPGNKLFLSTLLDTLNRAEALSAGARSPDPPRLYF